jgi:hypothetical protein
VRREATGPTAPGWRVDCGGGPDAAGAWEVGGPDGDATGQAGGPTVDACWGPLPLCRRSRCAADDPRAAAAGGAVGSRPASPAGRRRGPRGPGGTGQLPVGSWAARVAWRGRRGTFAHSPKLTSWGGARGAGPPNPKPRAGLGGCRGRFSTHPNSPVHGGPCFDTPKTDQLAGAPARPTPGSPDARCLWGPWAGRLGGASGCTRRPRRRPAVGVDRRTDIYPGRWGSTRWDHTTTVLIKDIF